MVVTPYVCNECGLVRQTLPKGWEEDAAFEGYLCRRCASKVRDDVSLWTFSVDGDCTEHLCSPSGGRC